MFRRDFFKCLSVVPFGMYSKQSQVNKEPNDITDNIKDIGIFTTCGSTTQLGSFASQYEWRSEEHTV